MGRGKQGGKWHFPLFGCGKKTRETKIWGKIFPPGPPFFILPIWEENEEGKVLKDALYTNTLSLSCIFFLSSLFPRQQCCPFFFFLATTLPVTLPFFFFFFLGNHVASCHFFFFFFSFFLFLGINIASFFFLIFFSFDFLGLGHDSLFLFLLDLIFFGTFLFL